MTLREPSPIRARGPLDTGPRGHALVSLALLFTLPLVLLLAAPLAALEFECRVPGETRYLRMELPGREHLCEVSVTDGDGERRVMWYADHESLFCSAKTYELRDKYIGTWTFDCDAWPDRDGVDRLSPRQRATLDTRLKTLLASGREVNSAPAVRGVRAAASTPLDDAPGSLALQFVMADGTDRVQVIADADGREATLVDLEGLAERVTAIEGLALRAALIESISEGGALGVITLLEREEDGASCEGRQVLRIGADGTLSPGGPHRHLCAAGGAVTDERTARTDADAD